MPISGEVTFLNQNVNSFFALILVGSFALAMGLLMLNIAFGYNPVVNLFLKQASATSVALGY